MGSQPMILTQAIAPAPELGGLRHSHIVAASSNDLFPEAKKSGEIESTKRLRARVIFLFSYLALLYLVAVL